MEVLVTGGAGYIGFHTCAALLEAGHNISVIDLPSDSSEVTLQRVEDVAGKLQRCVRSDVRNSDAWPAHLKTRRRW